MDNKIRTTLELLCRSLNDAFRNQSGRDEDIVALTTFVDAQGAPNPGAADKVVMFLANIEHEATISRRPQATRAEPDAFLRASPPLYIDLYVMFVANFSGNEYPTGLAAISNTISFFQSYPVLDHTTTPGLDPVVDKLSFEMCNLDIAELHHLVDMAGIQYLPLVMYKIRMLPFSGDAVLPTPTPIRPVTG